MVEPPNAPSPAANTFGSEVRIESHSVRTRSGPIIPAWSSSSQIPRCPTAAITEPHRISCSLPSIATGRRRPSSSGSPSAVFTHFSASWFPRGTTATCWVW